MCGKGLVIRRNRGRWAPWKAQRACGPEPAPFHVIPERVQSGLCEAAIGDHAIILYLLRRLALPPVEPCDFALVLALNRVSGRSGPGSWQPPSVQRSCPSGGLL